MKLTFANLLPFLTPATIIAAASGLGKLLVSLLNHKTGLYKDEIKQTLAEGFSTQTATLTKVQVECKDELVSAIKGIKA